MADWSELMSAEKRAERLRFSTELIASMDRDCLTRKPRDPVKLKLMRRLGLPVRYAEVQYPSPGNTPDDLEDDDF